MFYQNQIIMPKRQFDGVHLCTNMTEEVHAPKLKEKYFKMNQKSRLQNFDFHAYLCCIILLYNE